MTNNIKSQADSNLIATLDWEIPPTYFKSIIETHGSRGEIELKGCLSCKEFTWYLYLVNDGYVRLTLDCLTSTDNCFPTLYYDLKFGGEIDRPYVCRKGPLFSLSMGSNQYYSYGAINILILPLIAIQNNFMHLMPDNKLIISLKLCTHIGFNDATDVHEIKLCLNPMNEALVNDFANMLKDPKYSDVTIICAGDEALKAHKCILAARSAFFSQIFETITDEVITISDVDVSVMKLVLQFIYTGEIELSDNNVIEVLQFAEKYDLSELRTVCINKMCSVITE